MAVALTRGVRRDRGLLRYLQQGPLGRVRGHRRRLRIRRALQLGSPLLLASLLTLGGCAQGGEGFWPSISPTPRGAVAAPPRLFLSPLPENLWELLGGLGLLATGGGVVLFLWKFPDLLEEFSSLREMAERIHERRDRSTADLAQLSRRLTELEQQIIQIKRSGQRRAYPQASARSPVALSHRFDPPVGSQPVADALLPPLPGDPELGSAAEAAEVVDPGPDLASDAFVSASRASLALEQQRESLASAAPTLEALISAINGEGGGPIEGVTCMELDIATPDGAPDLVSADVPRLRLVAGGGRFLMVVLDGDPWLFPTVDTLANFRTEPLEEGIFHYLPDSCLTPRLIRPAMLRDLGGLWEVRDPGQILLPTA